MPAGGDLRIETSNDTLDEWFGTEAASGSFVLVAVTDTGWEAFGDRVRGWNRAGGQAS